MSQLQDVWRFTRVRLDASLAGLSNEQLNWRPYPGGHTIAENVYHTVGAEHYWCWRISGRDPSATAFDRELEAAVGPAYDHGISIASQGAKENTMEGLREAMDYVYALADEVMGSADEAKMQTMMISPLGDNLSQYNGLVRMSQHAGYHAGQIWQIRLHPDFPKS
ncbi:MAG: DinB family protein [Armatimonadetes bacterium]|nr:DinB family protein [Armatimonadota bacterium]